MICTIFLLYLTVIKKKKKKKNTGVGGNGSHSSGVERDRIFPQFFRGIGTGRD